MIVVEGMDNTGKSTLVQQLAEEFKLCKVATYCKPNSLQMIHDYDFWLYLSPQPLILDRHPFISDLVYGKVLRGYSYVTERQAQRWAEDHFIIHCAPPAHFIQKSFDDRPQMAGVKENLLKLSINYAMLMEVLPHITYDHTNLEGVRNAVSTYLSSSAGADA